MRQRLGSAMKQVVSFRLDEPAIAAARRRAKRRKQRFTNYIETVVLDDLARDQAADPTAAPAPPSVTRVLRLLRAQQAKLVRMGVRHAAIFGSLARGEDRAESDVDIVIETDPAVIRDLFAYNAVRRALEEMIGRKVDLARQDRLRPDIAAAVARDRIDVY
jgi:uncharacterized protein